MSCRFCRFQGFATLEALAAAGILSLALGSLVLLLTISAAAREQVLTRAQLRDRLNLHLAEMQGAVGAFPDCGLQQEEFRRENILNRPYEFKRAARSYAWEGADEPPALLQLSAEASAADGRPPRSELLVALYPCSRTSP